MNSSILKINEIFYSIQGEGTRAGVPCVFVRLAGCNLQCEWCDTQYALNSENSISMSFDEIKNKIKLYNCNFIEFTGGEPLLQNNVRELMNDLVKEGFLVAIETNGSIAINELNPNIIKIMDVKCPSSKMDKHNLLTNFNCILPNDELKFVIANKADFFWSDDIISRYSLLSKTKNILFSAITSTFSYKSLAELILKTNSQYRIQIQFHKIIWGKDAIGV